jgi:acyl carrier protein
MGGSVMIFEKVQEIIINQLGIDADEITRVSDIDDLGADSLDFVEILMAVEEEFDIEITDDEAEAIDTVEDLVECIQCKR